MLCNTESDFAQLIVVLFIGGDNSRKIISMAKWKVNKRLKKEKKQKQNTTCVGQHYTQPNTKNVNKT